MKTVLFGILCSVSALVSQAADGVAKYDKLMAAGNAAVDTNAVRWIDGRDLPLEGKWDYGTAKYYVRLPDGMSTNINKGVREMRYNTSGMQFRFRTDSDFLIVKFSTFNESDGMYHMSELAVSGWDAYLFDDELGEWRFVTSSHRSKKQRLEFEGSKRLYRIKRFDWVPGKACIINLPLYNGIGDFQLGIAAGAKIEPLGPRASGVAKPVVFYGTSITHGGCASRPGMSFVNILGRRLDVPVINLGFSGSGRMEYELSDIIAKIDASCYVLDCFWNMDAKMCAKNYEPFIRRLRELRPDVPIVMAGGCNVYLPGKTVLHTEHRRWTDESALIRELYAKLAGEGWQKLYYLDCAGMFSGNGEGTVDGVHPNDVGMAEMAECYGRAVREALALPEKKSDR